MRIGIHLFGLMFAALLALPVAAGPSETPPVGYTGQQYVDQSGCVFRRVETAGSVTWVQQLNAARQPICGQRPSMRVATGVVTTTAAATRRPQGRHPVQAAPAPPNAVHLVVPQGYRSAWDDDRLNPHRAKGTPQGEAQMGRIWTNTVPRRLVPDLEPIYVEVPPNHTHTQISTR